MTRGPLWVPGIASLTCCVLMGLFADTLWQSFAIAVGVGLAFAAGVRLSRRRSRSRGAQTSERRGEG